MIAREVPRKFEFHWGKGIVKEEASVDAAHHEPTIQLLQYASGERAIRFCSYEGKRFNRFPLIVDEESLESIAKVIRKNKELPRLLKRLGA